MLATVLPGAAAGALASLWLGPFLEDLLFRVPSRDAWSAGAGILVVALAAVLAAAIPARRAARIDPAVTLRQ
jgi:ABC-type lipoprotein release transport system permease subunit